MANFPDPHLGKLNRGFKLLLGDLPLRLAQRAGFPRPIQVQPPHISVFLDDGHAKKTAAAHGPNAPRGGVPNEFFHHPKVMLHAPFVAKEFHRTLCMHRATTFCTGRRQWWTHVIEVFLERNSVI